MKKSFLKRVMAAAVAVPVALSQTVMLASFAEGETTAPADDKITVVNTETFLQIKGTEAKMIDPSTSNYKAKEVKNPYAFVQESNWNAVAHSALESLYGETIELDPTKYADSIEGEAWYAGLAKDALKDSNAKISAKILGDYVEITISADYDYSETLTQIVEDNVPDEYLERDIDLTVKASSPVEGKIVIKVKTDMLATDKSVFYEVTDNTFYDMGEDPVANGINYLRSLLNQAKDDVKATAKREKDKAQAELNAANDMIEEAYAELTSLVDKGAQQDAVDEKIAELAELQKEADAAWDKFNEATELLDFRIDQIFKTYESKIDAVENRYNNFDGDYSNTVTGDTVDEILAKAEKFAASKSRYGSKLPGSLNGIKSSKNYNTVSNIFDDVVAQVNNIAVSKGYKVDMTLGDVIDVAATEVAGGIVVNGKVAGNVSMGDVFAYLTDELTDAEITYYTDELNKKLEAENKQVDEIYSVKVVEAEGAANAAKLTGGGMLNIYRVVWCDTKDLETTASTEETSTTASDEPTTTASEEPTTTASEEPTTTASEEPTTTASEEPTTTASEEPTTTASEEPTTTASEEPTTTASEEPTTTASEEPTTTASEEPTTTASEEPTTTETDQPSTDPEGRTDVKVVVAAGSKFYFSHDTREFNIAELIDLDNSVLLDENGEETAQKLDVTKISFGLDKLEAVDGITPEYAYDERITGAAYQFTPLYVYYEGELVSMTAYPEIYVAVKGDANLDGETKADDATNILQYAAELGAGNNANIYSDTNPILDSLAYFLADINGESKNGGESDAAGNAESNLDSTDASYILAYCAGLGAGGIDWVGDEEAIFTEAPYPAISKDIFDAKKAG